MPKPPLGRSLEELAAAAGDVLIAVLGDASGPVVGVAYDAGSVRPGDLFFCIRGATSDGHRFAPAAVASGAAALCVEHPTGAGVPEIVVSDGRRAMARICSAFFGYPGRDLLLVGVTGTNGKTTTAWLIESILEVAGLRPGLIGTIVTRFGGEDRPGVRTTPESLDLQRLFAEMRERGAGSVSMEVTSHALALQRVESVRFKAAAFTNLSQDHLDFHSSMEDYFEAKRSLFTPDRTESGAVNVDDEYGRRLADEASVPIMGFGLGPDADVRAESVQLGPHGSEFLLVTPAGECKVSTSLAGEFNVLNCLAAAAAGLQGGVSFEAVEEGLGSPIAVPGRFESVDLGQPFSVVVDYAHSPDSLENVLRAARNLSERSGGRVLCAFGCGGDRDRGKRPLMGGVAARLADYVVVTSDNPRSEDPRSVIDQILSGVVVERARGADAEIVDRADAIAHLLSQARPGDVVVITGKGHETGQEFADRTIAFDDRVVARTVLAEQGWGG
jgi:UDP-N-acetylmuramoyl-L-alanyl-D-glutamate--2,6-diaminopimelate ligase